MLAVAGLAVAFWVFAPVPRGPEAARRDVGTHRLALGSVVVVLLLNAILVAPLAPLLRSQDETVVTFLVAAIATEIPMLLVLYTRLILPRALSWWDLGLRSLPVAEIGRTGALVSLAALTLTYVVGQTLSLFGLRSTQLEQFTFIREGGVPALLLVLLVGSVFAPFVEELFFRGFIFGTLLRRKPRWMAYVGSSLLFSLLHANPRAMGPTENLALVVGVFVLGSLLAWTYERTGSLYPGMLAHAINNTLALAAVFAGAAS